MTIPEDGMATTAERTHRSHTLGGRSSRRRPSDETDHAGAATVRRRDVPWIAVVPDALLKHERQRERPSDFCTDCVE
jgi:hypothetical protein